jgi:hypothetical protein
MSTKHVECSDYNAGSAECQRKSFLNLWVRARESQLSITALTNMWITVARGKVRLPKGKGRPPS